MTWIKERVDRAKFFGSRPKTYPYVSASYTIDEGKYHSTKKSPSHLVNAILTGKKATPTYLKRTTIDEIQRLVGVMEKLKQDPKWYAWASQSKFPLPETPAIGSMQATFDHLLKVAYLGGLTLFEATGEKGRDFKMAGGYHHGYYSNIKKWAQKDTTYVYFFRHDVWEERGVYQSKHHFVLQYKNGQLVQWLIHSPEREFGEPLLYSNLVLGTVDYQQTKLWRMNIVDIYTERNTEPGSNSTEVGMRLSTLRPDRENG